jgi:hypothetical protein
MCIENAGGNPRYSKINIDLKTHSNIDEDTVKRHIESSSVYPKVEWGSKSGNCAVIGGSPDVDLDELREFEGDIYALNNTAGYLAENGIKSIFCMCDGTDNYINDGGMDEALLASRVHPDKFKAKDIKVWDLYEDVPEGIPGGSTITGRTPVLMLKIGYKKVFYYGCDGSFEGEYTHSGKLNAEYFINSTILVRANEKDYITCPVLYEQCILMKELMSYCPDNLINKSGGLLKAVLESDDHYCIGVSGQLRKYANAELRRIK